MSIVGHFIQWNDFSSVKKTFIVSVLMRFTVACLLVLFCLLCSEASAQEVIPHFTCFTRATDHWCGSSLVHLLYVSLNRVFTLSERPILPLPTALTNHFSYSPRKAYFGYIANVTGQYSIPFGDNNLAGVNLQVFPFGFPPQPNVFTTGAFLLSN